MAPYDPNPRDRNPRYQKPGRRATARRAAAIPKALLVAAALASVPAAARAEEPPATARAEEPPAALTGAAAWARVVGNTLSGTTPDGPYDELFATDGTLTIVDGDGKAGGTWRWRDDRLCTRVDGEEEDECRSVAVTGTGGAFTDVAGSRYPFTIRPGNPKGL